MPDKPHKEERGNASQPRKSASVQFQQGDLVAGQFEVVRVLGKGGMGVVYLVKDRVTRQHLALKTIKPSIATLKGVPQAFVREITAARRLRHPGIVAVFDVRQQGTLMFFTMEYVEGETLRALLRRKGHLPLTQAVQILRALCDALRHAHEIAVHRDLSPENIMVTRGGIKILDFGIAQVLDEQAPSVHARGKGPYTAPEQQVKGHAIDARADIYALGAILYEMVTGKHLAGPITPETRLPEVPEKCLGILQHTAASLERRYSSAAQMQSALDNVFAQLSPAAGTPDKDGWDALEQAMVSAAKRQQRSPWLVFAIMVLLVIAAPGLVFLGLGYFGGVWTGSREAPSEPVARAPVAQPLERPEAPKPLAQWDVDRRDAVLHLRSGATIAFSKLRVGDFMMGAPEANGMNDYTPNHMVSFSEGIWMGKYEITRAQWEAVMHTRPWQRGPAVPGEPDTPATNVSWDDAQRFISRLNAMNAGTFRLPTEAEWEYGCRAGSGAAYWFGADPAPDELDANMWYYDNTASGPRPYPSPVGLKAPNRWGLYDMHGNVEEWCQDWYDATYYAGSPQEDPPGPANGTQRVVRGGSWHCFAKDCTSYCRSKAYPNASGNTTGFRICREID